MRASLLRRSVRAAPVHVVAAWQGWCGACAAEGPLVLTRTGRRTPASWWAGDGDDQLPLTLTCRVCGVGVDVPLHEEDDPEPVEAFLPPAVVVPAPRAVSATPVAPTPALSDDEGALALLAAGWSA